MSRSVPGTERLTHTSFSAPSWRSQTPRAALLETASLEDLPGLAAEVERLHAAAVRLFAKRGRAVVEVRATSSKQVGNRTFGTSLGSGGPVRFQLPELKSVRIGTTVGVPLGGP